jgi:hypothetical protein
MIPEYISQIGSSGNASVLFSGSSYLDRDTGFDAVGRGILFFCDMTLRHGVIGSRRLEGSYLLHPQVSVTPGKTEFIDS